VGRDGTLWIGQTGLLTSIKDGRIHRYDTKDGFPNKWISAIGEDDEGLVVSG